MFGSNVKIIEYKIEFGNIALLYWENGSSVVIRELQFVDGDDPRNEFVLNFVRLPPEDFEGIYSERFRLDLMHRRDPAKSISFEMLEFADEDHLSRFECELNDYGMAICLATTRDFRQNGTPGLN